MKTVIMTLMGESGECCAYGGDPVNLATGNFIYRQVSTNLFQGIDEQLQLAQLSFEKDEPWEGADPAGVASDGASKGNDSFDVGLGGFSGDLFAAMERNVGENPQLIFVIRSLDGSIQSGIALYEVEPDYLDDIPFDKKDLDAPRLRICNGHNLRTVTSAVQNDDGVTVGYVQVIANVDSEMGILDTFTKTMAVGFAIALVLAAAASYLLSRRMIRPIARSWRKQSEFVQNASHELRTPLSVIKTTQELLLEHPNDRIIDHFEGIAATIDESDRLARLAGDLLALTALDAGNLRHRNLLRGLTQRLSERAIARRRPPAAAQRRRRYNTHDWLSINEERDEGGPHWDSTNVVLRRINRVNHPLAARKRRGAAEFLTEDLIIWAEPL